MATNLSAIIAKKLESLPSSLPKNHVAYAILDTIGAAGFALIKKTELDALLGYDRDDPPELTKEWFAKAKVVLPKDRKA